LGKKFKLLSDGDKALIRNIRSKPNTSLEEKLSEIQSFFGISERTVWRWLAKLKKKQEPLKEVKVLLFDIETAPLKAYVWSLWNQDIHYKSGQLDADWFMLSWSAKWLFEKGVVSDRLKSKEAAKEDDSRIVKTIWKLLDEAQIVVGHNVKRFDLKRLNTRFLKHGLCPPSHYQIVDTLTHCKKQFALTSNRLDYIGEFLGVGGKMDTGGFELWKRCMEGDETSLKIMNEYCDRDVLLLEEVYLLIRPYIRPHPSLSIYIEQDIEICPTCLSPDLKWEGEYATNSNLFKAFRCNSCGSIGRSKETKLSKEKRANALMPTSR